MTHGRQLDNGRWQLLLQTNRDVLCGGQKQAMLTFLRI